MSELAGVAQSFDRDHAGIPGSATRDGRTTRVSGSDVAGSAWAQAESLRLVQQIFPIHAGESPKVIVFAGVEHGSGSGEIAAAVAEILSRDSHLTVCLVGANLRLSSPPSKHIAATGRGLVDALQHPGLVSDYAQVVSKNLWSIPAGTVGEKSPSLLTSERLRETVTELRAAFDIVIIDTAPLGPYSDAVAFGQLADGVVLVIQADVTRKEAALVATDRLRAAAIPILAGVLSDRSYPIPERLWKIL